MRSCTTQVCVFLTVEIFGSQVAAFKHPRQSQTIIGPVRFLCSGHVHVRQEHVSGFDRQAQSPSALGSGRV